MKFTTPDAIDRMLRRLDVRLRKVEPTTSVATAPPLDIVMYVQDVLDAGVYVMRALILRRGLLPADAVGSQAESRAAATAAREFTVYRVRAGNTGTDTLGTINFAAGSSTGVFNGFTTSATLAEGDTIAVLSPATSDATLADVSITLKCSRLV